MPSDEEVREAARAFCEANGLGPDAPVAGSHADPAKDGQWSAWELEAPGIRAALTAAEKVRAAASPTDGWMPAACAPIWQWLRTKREGEDGENVCALRIWPDGEREWVERDGGRTTVTHSTFLPPTHWQPLPPAPEGSS